eukprot:3827033-Prymnesium_polylepis.1
MRTLLPATTLALVKATSAVAQTIGRLQACANVTTGGLATSHCAGPRALDEREPTAKPKAAVCGQMCCTRSPTADTTPEQSPPGGPGSPGYSPSTFNTSRKLSPTVYTLISACCSSHRDTNGASAMIASLPIAPRVRTSS